MAVPKYPELYILRHGQTEWNAEGRMQGGLNSSLTALGQAQAQQQATLLAKRDLSEFDALMSPQARAVQTAALVLAGHRHTPFLRTDDRLREIGVGAWQGVLRSSIDWQDDAYDGPDGPLAFYAAAPQGEGFSALHRRCADFLSGLAGPAVLVTHGVTSRMLRTVVLGRDPSDIEAMGDLPGGQGVVFHLRDGIQRRLA